MPGGGSNPVINGNNRSPQRWRREAYGGQSTAPYPSIVSTGAPIFSSSWQIGAVYTGSVSVPVPANGAGTYYVSVVNVALVPQIPSSITIAVNQQVTIIPSVAIGVGSSVVNSVLVSSPQVSVYFGSGGGSTYASPGTLTTFTGPVTLNGPGIKIAVPLLYQAAVAAATTLRLNVSALLIGVQN